jgi:hypothetical protein
MNKLEELKSIINKHLGYAEQEIYDALDTYTTEITSDVAIKFAKWVETDECKEWEHDFKIVGESSDKQKLFQIFINNHYGKNTS